MLSARQYKTATADKSGKIPFKNALNLTRKHKDYLIKEKAYLASRAMVYALFHAHAGHYWRTHLLRALAYGLLPTSILGAKLASRLVRDRRHTDGLSRYPRHTPPRSALT